MNPLEQALITAIEDAPQLAVILWLLMRSESRADRADQQAHEAKDRHIVDLQRFAQLVSLHKPNG